MSNEPKIIRSRIFSHVHDSGAVGTGIPNPLRMAFAKNHNTKMTGFIHKESETPVPTAPPPDPFEARYGYETAERAAIIEYEAGLSRAESERAAIIGQSQ